MQTFEEFKKEFEQEAYEDYRAELVFLTGMEPALPREGAPVTWRYQTLLQRFHDFQVEQQHLASEAYD